MPDLYHGETQITAVYHGADEINQIWHGSNLVYARFVIRDDFDRDDMEDLSADGTWTDLGPSTDRLLGITDGAARLQTPDGLIGSLFAMRTSRMRYGLDSAPGDDGYIEARMSTRGDPFTALSGSTGYRSDLFGRCNDSFTHGVGMRFVAGVVRLVRRVSGTEAFVGDHDGEVVFQPGDTMRKTHVGNMHRLFLNGVQRAEWNDSGATAQKGASYRHMVIRADGGKDFLGPRRFSPAFDYVEMG